MLLEDSKTLSSRTFLLRDQKWKNFHEISFVTQYSNAYDESVLKRFTNVMPTPHLDLLSFNFLSIEYDSKGRRLPFLGISLNHRQQINQVIEKKYVFNCLFSSFKTNFTFAFCEYSTVNGSTC